MYIPHGTHFEEYCFLSYWYLKISKCIILCRYVLQTVIWWWIFSKFQDFEEKLLLFFPNIKILKKHCYYLYLSTFYESNNGVIGIIVSENMKNDSSIMFIPYLFAKIY